LPKNGSSIGSSDIINAKSGPPEVSETESYVGSHSATHSVTDYDDMATLSNKFKTLRRENQQLKTLLRQNELIIT